MSDETPPHAPGAVGPQIGADEWVARAGERTEARRGPIGAVRRRLERVPEAAWFALFAVVAALIPVFVSNQYLIRVGTVTLVYSLLGLGLNVAVGFAGLLDLGYIAYYGIGAYGYAMLSSSKFGVHLPAWESIPIVLVVATCIGFVLALPSRRLTGDYLAIVTLFFGQMFYTIVTQGYRMSFLGFSGSHDITGGPNGIANVDRIHGFGLTASSEQAYFYITLVAVMVVFTALHLADRSRTGRAWRALHDDSLASQVMSIPINRLKVLAIGVGACAAALAGAINGALIQGAFPDDYNTQVLIVIYAVVIIGGAGSLPGVVLGAIVINVSLEVLRGGESGTFAHARWIYYLAILGVILGRLRPWRRVAFVLGGTALLGVVVHEIVGAVWPRGVHGRLALNPTQFGDGGWLGWILRHWLALPANTYDVQKYTVFNILLCVLIALLLVLTTVHGWMRDLLMIPTLWLGAFVWETRLVEETSGPTRFLLLGVALIVVMAARPQGLLGKPRVEIV